MRGASIATFVFVVLWGAPGRSIAWAQSDAGRSEEILEEQRDIRELLFDLARRMRTVADRLEGAQPQDAKRMREAAELIQTSDLNRTFEEITRLLESASFLEALGRQDQAIEGMESVLKVLEGSRFEETGLGMKREELQRKRQRLEQLSRSQKSLLDHTREFLQTAELEGALESLKNQVSELARQQEALGQGKRPDEIDPEEARAEAEALKAAREAAAKLVARQERVNQGLATLPEPSAEAEEVRRALDRVEELLDQARQVTRAQPPGGKGQEAPGAERDPSAEAPTSGEPKAGEPKAGEPKAGEPKAGEPKAGEPKAGEPKAGEPKAGEPKAGEPRAGEPKAGEPKAGEPRAGEPKAGESDSSARESPSRPSGEAPEARAQRARELAEGVRKLLDDWKERGKDTPPIAKDLERAGEGAESLSESLQKEGMGDSKEAAEPLLSGLESAQRKLSAELSKLNEGSAGQRSGLQQEEGLLGKEAASQSKDAQSQAEQRSSSAARESMEEGSRSLSEASEAMKQAAESLAKGDSKGAREAGQKAQAAASKAEDAFSKGEKALAGRSEEEKAGELQKKIARKAEEAKEAAEELEPKLEKKTRTPPRGLGDAKESLSDAAKSMKEAVQAAQEGKGALARQKQEEALERLKKAEERLQEERDQLARLKKPDLKKDAQPQDELAKITRQAAQQDSASGDDSPGDDSSDLQGAAESMEQASKDLGNEQAESAEKNQEEALARLEGREKELREEEERLAQLEREEELISMVEELSRVRNGEEDVHTATVAIHSTREPQESRRKRLEVQRSVGALVTAQEKLREAVTGLNEKLQKELARVFSFVLKNVAQDMTEVRDALKDLDTGSYTQFLQKDILQQVDRLVAMLKERIENPPPPPPPSPPGPPQPSGPPPLVPPVAELRMLREMQEDVRSGTRDLEDLRKASGGEASEAWDRALNRLSQKQGSISKMLLEIIEDFKKMEASRDGQEEPPPEEER